MVFYGLLLMKWFKLFVIACKIAILSSYFAFFLLRSAAMQCKKVFTEHKSPIFRLNKKSLNHFNMCNIRNLWVFYLVPLRKHPFLKKTKALRAASNSMVACLLFRFVETYYLKSSFYLFLYF